MDKKYLKIILAVMLGIALTIMVYELVSLLFNSIYMKDAIEFAESNNKLKETMEFIQSLAIALTCTIGIMFVCYVFAYFGNGKIFNTAAAALSLLTAVMSIVFVVLIRNKAHDAGAVTYSAVAEIFDEFITLAVSALLGCAYFVYNSVISFIGPKKHNDSEE